MLGKFRSRLDLLQNYIPIGEHRPSNPVSPRITVEGTVGSRGQQQGKKAVQILMLSSIEAHCPSETQPTKVQHPEHNSLGEQCSTCLNKHPLNFLICPLNGCFFHKCILIPIYHLFLIIQVQEFFHVKAFKKQNLS